MSEKDTAVLFDFFGTLVEIDPAAWQRGIPDTYRLARRLGYLGDHDDLIGHWNEAWTQLGRRAESTHHEFSGFDGAAAVAESAGLDLTDEQIATFGDAFRDEWSTHVRSIADVPAMIRELSRSHAIGIVSNTHDTGLVPSLVTSMGIGDDVDTIVLSITHGRIKPHGSIYRAALDELGVDATGAVFVGDNYEADYVGPRRLGMSAYLIDPGRRAAIPDDHRLSRVVDIASVLQNARPG